MNTEHAVLIIDNFDSFTHNLAALVEEASPSPCQVMRAAEGRRHIEEPWQAVIFGPGPSVPDAHPDLLACLRASRHHSPWEIRAHSLSDIHPEGPARSL